MSAPALADPLAMPTMVSRLPKFGSRPKPAAPAVGAHAGPAAAVNTAARLTNGFYHHPGPAATAAEVKGGSMAPASSVRQNGFIRMPSTFSMKWRKGNGGAEEGGADGEREGLGRKGGNTGQNRTSTHYLPRQQASPQRSPLAAQREAKKPAAPSAGKGRGFGQAVTSSPSPSPQSSPRTLPVSKTGGQGTKLSQTPSGLTNGTKQNLNGVSGSRQRLGTGSSLRVPLGSSRPAGSGGSRPGSGPGSRSGSPLSNPPASRSHSSDSLGSGPSSGLTEGDRLRSRSLTQVRRLPSPTLTPPTSTSSSLPRSSTSSSSTVSRSYSFNRAAERGFKEPSSPSAQAPPRAPLAKSPLTRQSGVGGGGGFGFGVKAQSSAVSGRSGVGGPSLLPPSALKKPLLPGLGATSKPSGISYKLSRPSLIKQPRPLRVTSANTSGSRPEVSQALTGRRNSVETPSTAENSPDSTPEAPDTEGLSAEPVSQGEVSIVGETLEDMSLSSTSSLERNDMSQEYMDDFDNLGNGGVGLLLLSSGDDADVSGLDQSRVRFGDDKVAANGVTEATELCSFLEDSLDWAGVRLSGEQVEHLARLSRQRRSSQPDYHDQGGSSLDLSPSDSCGSGGTYMWDEEGLEPLSSAAPTNNNNTTNHHRRRSYDSDLNSIDVLNNLDSCDLDDDDLMLDADFPEDASLQSEGGGSPHMAQWRRRQLCWGTQDVHSDSSDFQCFQLTEDPGNKRTESITDKDLGFLSPARSPCLSPGPGPGFGLDVEELAEDCSAVKAQLEYLKSVLLQEEDVDDITLTADTVSLDSPEDSASSEQQALQTQVQELLQEVQQLREELRSRDRTIAQLTQQLTVPMAPTRCRCQETEAEGSVDRHTPTSVKHEASQTPWREHSPQILHSTRQEDQEPLTSPDHNTDTVLVPAADPTDPATSPRRLPGRPDAAEEAGRRDREEEEEEEEDREGGQGRLVQLAPPSKPRHFLFPNTRTGSVPIATTAAPTARALRQPSAPHNPEHSAASGSKFKAFPLGSGSSRLPKPKSH